MCVLTTKKYFFANFYYCVLFGVVKETLRQTARLTNGPRKGDEREIVYYNNNNDNNAHTHTHKNRTKNGESKNFEKLLSPPPHGLK